METRYLKIKKRQIISNINKKWNTKNQNGGDKNAEKLKNSAENSATKNINQFNNKLVILQPARAAWL